ncbi:hypothetical protein JB92DRAFT_2980785 [Gautieria morchelliformis]|nr:hypothetical protein JB92DRAFT_2980785 [Gautieria morchelliformis]
MATTNEETPLSQKIVPARGAAQRAAATMKEQTKRPRKSAEQKPPEHTLGSGLTEDDDDAGNVDSDSSQDKSVKVSRGLRGRRRGRGTAVRGVRRHSSQKSMKSVLQSPRSPSPLHSGSVVTPQKRSPHSTSNAPSKRAKLASYSPQPRTTRDPGVMADLLTSSPSCRSPSKYANIYIENDVVWVRLNSRGALIDPTAPVEQVSYWWPAQVTTDDPLEVSTRLFGDDGHGNERVVNISSPSSSTVLSFRDEGCVRFSSSTFSLPHSHIESPDEANMTRGVSSKLVRRWTNARDQALEADVDDELPEGPSLITLLGAAGKGKKRREGDDNIDLPQTPTPTRLKKRSAAPLDEEIKVGEVDGELVLASDHKGRPDHWPARVVAVHQDKRSGKWLYEVCYIDGKRKKMERKRLFTSDEDGFATCQLGQWRTEFPSDTEAPDSEDEIRDRYITRAPSPSPSNADLEDITDPVDFCALPLEKQMRYVYPFLCHVIRREYEPSYERHDIFIKGGKARQQLAQAASMRGRFSENEVKKALMLVRRTMLRDERWAERVKDGDEVCGGERDIAPSDGSDATKAESLAESMPVPSLDINAAVVPTEFKSSDIVQDMPVFSRPILSSHADVDRPDHDGHPSSQTLMAESDTNANVVLSSSIVLDQSSDMELDSDEEHTQISPPPKTLSSGLKASEVTGSSPLGRSAKEIPVLSASRMRPKGCDAYENLSRSERGLYCADVLFPEAVLQLHLLRAGRRSSPRLLTPEEESALYEEGQELLGEGVHWITQIVQMRQLAENNYKRRTKKKKGDAPMDFIGGTSTRPKSRKVSR